jgi:hypothetical protein
LIIELQTEYRGNQEDVLKSFADASLLIKWKLLMIK